MYDLFCLGGASLDLILRVPHLPEPDEKLVARFEGRAAGGLISNAACAAARLGLRTGWSGQIGADDGGRLMLAEFEKFGVQAGETVIRPGETTDFCVILLEPGGERTILVVNTIAGDPPLTDGVLAALRQTRRVYTMPRGEAWFKPVAAAVHAAGGQVVVDLEASSPVRGAALQAALCQTDIVFTNRGGLALVSGGEDVQAGAEALLSLGVALVVVTLGKQGAAALTRGEVCSAPGYAVPVVDATGAGDCFHAAYLKALAGGLPPAECLRFANAAAALKVQHLGPRGGLPDEAAVRAFLQAQE